MARWKKIEKVLNVLKTRRDSKYRKFRMESYIRLLTAPGSGWYWPEDITVAKLRANGPECGSACCIAGEAIIQLAPLRLKLSLDSNGEVRFDNANKLATKIFGLTDSEANFMFGGEWRRQNTIYLDNIPKRDAIIYLEAVLANKNIFMKLPVRGRKAYVYESPE